jgi:hypothetical protein
MDAISIATVAALASPAGRASVWLVGSEAEELVSALTVFPWGALA